MAVQYDVIREELTGLEYVVQCRGSASIAGWESIAAFDSAPVAKDYAAECKDTNKRYDYRVLELSTLQPTHAIIFQTVAQVKA